MLWILVTTAHLNNRNERVQELENIVKTIQGILLQNKATPQVRRSNDRSQRNGQQLLTSHQTRHNHHISIRH